MIPDDLNRRKALGAGNTGDTSIDTYTLEYHLPDEKSHKIRNTDYKSTLEGWLRTSDDIIQTHGNIDEEPSPEQKISAVTNLLEAGLALGFFGAYKRDFAADKHKTQTIGEIFDNSRDDYLASINSLFNIAKEIGIDTEEYERRAKKFIRNFKVTNVSKPLFTLNDRNRRLQELLSAQAEIRRPIDMLAHPDTYDPNVSFRDLVGVSLEEYNSDLYAFIRMIVRNNDHVMGIGRVGSELHGKEHPLYVWDFDREKLQGMVDSAREYEILIEGSRQQYNTLVNRWLDIAKKSEISGDYLIDLAFMGYYLILAGKIKDNDFRFNEILDKNRSRIIGGSARLLSKIEDDKVRNDLVKLYDAALDWQVK